MKTLFKSLIEMLKRLFSKSYRNKKYIESLDFGMFSWESSVPKKPELSPEDKHYQSAFFRALNSKKS